MTRLSTLVLRHRRVVVLCWLAVTAAGLAVAAVAPPWSASSRSPRPAPRLEGVGGQVGQLHALEAGPQRLDRVQLGGVAG
jgi:hypothetical protein